MDIKALGDHIILEPFQAPKMMGGVLLPESSREEVMSRPIGVVVSVGPDVNKAPEGSALGELPEDQHIDEGDVIAYWPLQSKVAYIPGQDTLVRRAVRRGDVIGKVKSDPIATAAQMKATEDRHDQIEREMREAQASRGKVLVAERALPKIVH